MLYYLDYIVDSVGIRSYGQSYDIIHSRLKCQDYTEKSLHNQSYRYKVVMRAKLFSEAYAFMVIDQRS